VHVWRFTNSVDEFRSDGWHADKPSDGVSEIVHCLLICFWPPYKASVDLMMQCVLPHVYLDFLAGNELIIVSRQISDISYLQDLWRSGDVDADCQSHSDIA
jgi:hypothetical protein